MSTGNVSVYNIRTLFKGFGVSDDTLRSLESFFMAATVVCTDPEVVAIPELVSCFFRTRRSLVETEIGGRHTEFLRAIECEGFSLYPLRYGPIPAALAVFGNTDLGEPQQSVLMVHHGEKYQEYLELFLPNVGLGIPEQEF